MRQLVFVETWIPAFLLRQDFGEQVAGMMILRQKKSTYATKAKMDLLILQILGEFTENLGPLF